MSRQELENARIAVDRYRKKQIESEQKKKILEEQLKGQAAPCLTEVSEKLQKLQKQQQMLEQQIRKLYSRREKGRGSCFAEAGSSCPGERKTARRL